MTSTASSTDTRQGQAAEERRPSWQQRLRRFGYNAPPRSDVRDRLVPPYAEPSPRIWAAFGLRHEVAERITRWSGWGGPLLVTLMAGLMRFWNLGSPKAVIFDETYYAKDAWALIHRGYEVNWDKNANDLILQNSGHVGIPSDAAYVVHPPVGKYVIGLGEWMFGFNPFGWRFMTALLGTLSVLLLCRIGRRMFRSTFLGCLAGALMAVDGLHFVMSRTSLLDGVLMFFVLAAFGCLIVDRDRARARLAAALPTDADGLVRPDAHIAESTRLGWRPWRWTAGLMLGLALGTKWSGLYVLFAFCLMAVLWDVGARRVAGARHPYMAALKHDTGITFLATVPVAIATYFISWTGWILSPTNGKGGYFRNWAATDGKGGSWTFLPDWLRSLWHYEHEVYEFHVGLSSPHTYQSNPWSWIVLGRPVSYFYESPLPGKDGCPADAGGKCAREVLALGTPLLWWAACFAIVYVLWRWAFRRDWRAGAIACGIAAGYLPWFMYQERTIFFFYAIIFVPFLCLAVAMMIGAILGPPGSTERRRVIGAASAGVLVLLIAWNFIYFWPLYTGTAIPIDQWRSRMWLDTWV
ncbi:MULTISPECIES: dolichyl-phosphate-mannose--protein mannosyltransferase [Streptomyces]|uniref:Polyprenol-phosphate-mannose--protein mannosyltransferase n=1 Tax=Streptomyces mirabilis TaxID=68239 RepID=A0ABU3US50_9ACTN|nr:MULTISPECIES: phospholipid carrier-dependent glycosyltransferase [Streptomyces]MCX4609591.1 phospholipid carrier-dependent glycosyltransferase [Streptomyces mirabilis]MCX5349872.1 phospholipid carrier-dependent glycosyltransferase [Streptomyces mirabilis]MCZ1000416.1 phospholipid carrier-dependent glycosyltransferase [Streptomyces mirabilis]MDU8996748.1 phospholipid carrier-dependent glycosyltransferase [Streptomyces mirabilis]NMI58924.1 phospholipid carrier-dependent glycosyltransferase [S